MKNFIAYQINRYYKYFKREFFNYIESVKAKIFCSNNSLKIKHLNWILENNINTKKEYMLEIKESVNINNIDTKLIAFYLPQFYENEVNNKYFGKGFMEWYNVTKAIPQFTGHYQPHLPIDVGFYNLSHDDIMYRQIELAKKYGIYGFCFYYYWFSGERLLEKPLDNFLNNKDLNMPFCLFWANETWTNLWGDGNERKIIKEQKLRDDDDEKFVTDILKYFNDQRYIKIDNKPLLIIYRSQIFKFERFQKFIKHLRTEVKNAGYKDVNILLTDADIGSITNMAQYNIDGIVEFTHRDISHNAPNLDMHDKFLNPNFKGCIYDIEKALNKKYHLISHNYEIYKSITCGWDNTPRKAYSGAMIFHMNPSIYKKWMKDIIMWTKNNRKPEEQFVFIDSWNEWAEGAHLEPDQHYGYAYLQATKEALEETVD